MKLNRAERLYLHKSFWGLSGATPEIQIGEGASWVTMTAAPSYTPPVGWTPPTGFVAADAAWYQVLVAGPDATSNPGGTIVVPTNTARVRTKVTAGDEIDIQPDEADEYIILIS